MLVDLRVTQHARGLYEHYDRHILKYYFYIEQNGTDEGMEADRSNRFSYSKQHRNGFSIRDLCGSDSTP